MNKAQPLCIAVALAGCGSGPREDMIAEPSADVGNTDGSNSTTGGDETSAEDDVGDGVLLDVGGGADGGSGGCAGDCGYEKGCTAVDIVFVIDNSVSMEEHQIATANAFPLFAQTIVDNLPPGINIHVGVTTTEMGFGGEGGSANCMLSDSGTGQPISSLEYYVPPTAEHSGRDNAQGRLVEVEGKRFYEISSTATETEIEDLSYWFAVASHVGVGGSNVEMAAAPAAWVLDGEGNPENAGFLRDEGAVLAYFFLQDEPDQTPLEVREMLMDKIRNSKAECGSWDCIVGGGFVNEACLGDATALGVLMDKIDGVTEDLAPPQEPTSEDIAELLAETLGQVIVETCAEIPVPQP